MTATNDRGTATEKNDAWNRRKHLLFGQRLYSNRETAMWLAGKPVIARLDQQIALAKEAEAARWIAEPDLSRLVDGDDIAESGRYMTATERLSRLFAIADHFASIRAGSVVPIRYRRLSGIPVRIDNDGPTAMWRAWAKAIWATLPANDSDIFVRTATTASPKNAHLAERLDLLLAWARMRQPLSLDATNWLHADNDNYDEEEPVARPAFNRERRIRPGSSDAELLSFTRKAGPAKEWRHAKLGGSGDIEMRPIDITLQRVPDKTDKAGRVTKSHSVIVRAGKLRIANGKTYLGADRVEEGTILHQPDRFGELLGPEADHDELERSNGYWVSLLSSNGRKEMEPVRFIPKGKMRRQIKLTEEDRRVLLAGPLPPVTYCRPGLPCGAPAVSDNFVGNWISNPKGAQPPKRWGDISDELSRQQEFERWAAGLPADELKALNLACTAANFSEVGEAFERVGKSAERYGKKILVAANDNLKKIIAA